MNLKIERGLTVCLLATAIGAWGHEGPHRAPPRVMRTQSQALQTAFPGLSVDRKTAFLNEAQVERASRLSECVTESAVVTYYVARSTAGPAGAAFFEAHRLRDGNETIMVVLTPEGRLARTEILSFDEPADYMPPMDWRASLLGRKLVEQERFSRLPGASPRAALSAQAFLEGVRRLMAVSEVIAPHTEKP